MNKYLLSLVVLCIVSNLRTNNPAFSQACCTGGAPLSSNLGIKSYTENALIIDLSYDYNKLDQLYAGSNRLDDSNRERITRSALLRISYPLSKKWTITSILPYVWQEQTVFSSVGNTKQSANGIGDIVLLGQYTLHNSKKHQVLLAAGPKFPTGTVYKRDSEFGLLLPPDLQPGTGSWDGIGALSYSHFGLFRPTLSLHSLLSYRYSFEVGRYNGGQEYRFGNETIVNLGLSDSFVIGNKILNAGLQYKLRHTQQDENNGSNFPNTGGTWMYLVPNLDLQVSPKVKLHANFEMPIHTDVTGTQLVTSYRANIGLNYTINLK
ncbi:transporter [Marinifilum caeruleilacunae]|uniref:Transporter n=1 Tax=Marinifilum caeruleilacunae TaxID=2499076 RepID=A0ABX1WR71_9BACT|nr:transporter [Marinifilum caeruleilacunae]NOU58563.1 transporter [Marinifilum caeruleilacunae]